MLAAGPHVNRGHRPIAEAVREALAEEPRARAVALFAAGPRGREVHADVLEEGADALRRALEERGAVGIAHSSYTATSWMRGDPDAARCVREELAACPRAGLEGVVCHLPKLAPDATDEDAARVVAKYAGRLRGRDGARLYLETPAHPGSRYAIPEVIAAAAAAVAQAAARPTGVCVDTAHLWTAGVDVSLAGPAYEYMADVGRACAEAQVALMVHLNDSARPLGRGPDRHAPIGAGLMWAGGRDGYAGVLRFCAERGVPVILERSGGAGSAPPGDPVHAADYRAITGALGDEWRA